MTPRLTSRMTVDSLLRRVSQKGGFGAMLARGDDSGGAILVLLAERGEVRRLLERTLDSAGDYRWTPCGPLDVESPASRDSYIQRRRERDPDLWLIELDIADAERFAAEMMPVC
jgi:hypothetical protein